MMKKVYSWPNMCQPTGIGLPLFLILIGVYFLLKNLGYIKHDALFWPIVAIFVGVYWLVQRVYNRAMTR